MVQAEGYLDHVSENGIFGWARDASDETKKAIVAIWTDKIEPQYIRADGYRPDLQQAGLGEGRHGFSVKIDFKDSEILYARVVGADGDLAGSPTSLKLGGTMGGATRRILRNALGIATGRIIRAMTE